MTRALLLLAVALAAAGTGLLARSHQTLGRAEQLSVDTRFQFRGAAPAKLDDFVLVDIDETTFNELRDQDEPSQWPFPRRYHAEVIDALRRAGASVIAYDVQFTEPTNPTDDNALIRAVGRARNVVLSTTTVGPGGTTTVLGGDDLLRELGARVGNTSVIPDSDGSIRATQYEIGGLRTFGVALAEAAGRPVERFSGTAPIDYAGPPGTLRSIHFSRVLSGRFPHAAVRGKVAIVGASALTLKDLHQTPLGGGAQMSGPEVLANASSTLLRGLPLRGPAGWLTPALIGAFALLSALVGLRFGTLAVALTGAALLAAWAVAAQLAFDADIVVDFGNPAAALVLATGGAALVGLWTDRRERRRLRELFAADRTAVVEGVLGRTGALAPTAIIAGYRIESVVGRGGMGVVYRATQLALEREVAIKLIATERAQDPVFRARFERESKLAASIEHVNVIPVYEAGEDDGLLYIVMRLVDGVDLAHVLAHDGALEPARAARLVAQLAGALDAAHGHGLVHRDVKPANILLTLDEPEHLYLTDFGVAKRLGDDGMTQAGGWVGTIDYLAPEQIRGEAAGPAGDIYALAAVLFHCLTGRVPYARDSDAAKLWAHVNAPLPALGPGFPPALDAVVSRGMAKEPAQRFRTAAELARACGEALGLSATPGVRRPPRATLDGPTVAATAVPE